MRKRFEQQLAIGQLPIEDTVIRVKSKNALDELLTALKAIYCHKEYNRKIFNILEEYIILGKKKTGRKGMDLWCIFVLSQVRLCLNISYDTLHNQANNHRTLRQIMGIERSFGYEPIEFDYQQIYDNVSMLSDELVCKINEVILEFGHGEVFKKKENTALHLKTDSFVVESNVHFPTDYSLLWDSARKCLDTVTKFIEKYQGMEGWRKICNWRYELKGLMRELGKANSSGGQNKQNRVETAARNYLKKARALLNKLRQELPGLPQRDTEDLLLVLVLEQFMLMDNQQDRDIVIEVADRILIKHNVASRSFDKGFWTKENKELLQLEIPQVVMPKLGKRNINEEMEESSRSFKRLKNKHSAIESNINELENRGLDRCPDRGIHHYKRYISLGICAYNLKKIGRQILKLERGALLTFKDRLPIAA